MAGISGPCPRCSKTIEAPKQANQPAPAAPVETPAPRPEPAPMPSSVPPAPAKATDQESEEATTIRPEPRSKPERTGARGITAKKSTQDASLRKRRTVEPQPSRQVSRPTRSSGVLRILLPIFFIVAGGTIVYVLCYFFLPGGPGDSLRRNSTPPPVDVNEQQTMFPKIPTPGITNEPDRPRDTPADTPVLDPPPLSADGAEAIAAEETLEQFLDARSLDDRLQLIDPPLPTEEAQGTILEKVLPEVISLSSETPSFNSLEKFTNYPFRVSFQGGEGSVVEYTILVRKRADLEPKVVVHPFLDLVGGRLARFAATPVDGARTFHAIIEAMPRCFEENVPDPEKKFTYKLSACDVGRTTARAYASKTSSLAEQLYSSDSRIRWGKRIRATVILQWNTTEDPMQPFLELLEIKDLDWNS
ncbi:MAG: hypothetical protein AAGI48_03040 [Verrucomicrobiota bacterium]